MLGCMQTYVEEKDVRALRAYFDKVDEVLWAAFDRVIKTHIARWAGVVWGCLGLFGVAWWGL
jgi:hypothetical protein